VNLKKINYKLVIEFEGSKFYGSQYQPNRRTVQGELEKVLGVLLRRRIQIILCGRTDAGVHAKGYVVNFITDQIGNEKKFIKSLNATLPADLAVLSIERVSLDFHARYSAKQRTYQYTLSTVKSPLERRRIWYCRYPVRVSQMRKMSTVFLGTHDFSAFSVRGSDPKSRLCTINEFSLRKKNEFIVFTISANRFLYKMVRMIIGTLVRAGIKYQDSRRIIEIMNQRDNRLAYAPVPAQGLCFLHVRY